jgi:hypothetical protein
LVKVEAKLVLDTIKVSWNNGCMTQHETNVILDEDQYEWVRAEAFNRKFSMSAIMRMALTEYKKLVEAHPLKIVKNN